jgi:hypothetical protein
VSSSSWFVALRYRSESGNSGFKPRRDACMPSFSAAATYDRYLGRDRDRQKVVTREEREGRTWRKVCVADIVTGHK